MSDVNLSTENIDQLASIGRALKYAEQSERERKVGSTPDELHRTRMAVEGFCSSVGGTQIVALRDLPNREGIQAIVTYHGKNRSLAISFDDLKEAQNDPELNGALYERWYKVIRSTTSILPEPEIVKSTARKVTKRK